MADEQLRMTATVRDQASGPLRQIQAQLRGIGKQPGVEALKKQMDGLKEAMSPKEVIQAGLATGLSAFGVTALSVTGVVAGLIETFKGFGERSSELLDFARQTGITAQRLRELEGVGEKFGLSQSQIMSGVVSFADRMNEIRHHTGEVYAQLRDSNPAVLKGLLESNDNTEALSVAIAALLKIQDPAQQRLFAQALLGNADMAKLGMEGAEGWRKALSEVIESLGTISGDQLAAGKEFSDFLLTMKQDLIGLRDAIAADVLPEINELLGGIHEYLIANRDQVARNIGDSIHWMADGLKQAPWKEIGSDIKTVGDAILGVAHAVAATIRAIGDLANWTDSVTGAQTAGGVRVRTEAIQKRLDSLNAEISKAQGSGDQSAAEKEKELLRDQLQEEMDDMKKRAAEIGKAQGTAAGKEMYDTFKDGIQKESFTGDGFGFGGQGGGAARRGALLQRVSLGGVTGADIASGGRGGGLSRGGAGGGTYMPGPGADKGTKYSGSSKNAGSWMNFLMHDMGATKDKAAAIVGMLQGESGQGLDPGIIGDHGTSGGTAQWHNERWAALRAFAAKQGKAWTDIGIQQQFFKREMKGPYAKVWNDMMAAHSMEDAVNVGVRRFEVPANPSAEVAKRIANARRLANGKFDEDVATANDAMKRRERAEVQRHDVRGKAHLKVDVNAPRGTTVSASAEGLFERVDTRRHFYNAPTPA
ncbi:hypothetical protein SAMN05216548_12613 [Faunimonas pinastri]|uniref:Phage tail lysozyme domain-containing protein n=1 Tax=Faunimonas pinastri TaxID=1855383 RepID=A0A1H9QAX6_9HYPH|nr:phage tail tip lysozyme [Faunimonas pinastri]SER56973.1 hypothetical protein SAMN05216548_12613 [Faunimonas pinastri]